MASLLRLKEIRKSFYGTPALKTAEVRALLGENGAGKSTLIKILAGAFRAAGPGTDQRNSYIRLAASNRVLLTDADHAAWLGETEDGNLPPLGGRLLARSSPSPR